MRKYLNGDQKNQMVAMMATQKFLESIYEHLTEANKACATEAKNAIVQLITNTLEGLDRDEIARLRRYGNSVRLVVSSTTEAKLMQQRKEEADKTTHLATDDFMEICSYSLLQCINCKRDHTKCRLRELMMAHEIEAFKPDSTGCQYTVDKEEIVEWGY